MSGIALAVLGLVVLGVAIFAIQNPRGAHTATDPTTSVSSSGPSTSPNSSGPSTSPSGGSTSPGGSSSSDESTASSLPTLAEAQQEPLVVLNNTTITGLAASAAARFGDAGWTVTSYGNLQNDILSTCAYYDPSDPAARPAARVLRNEFPTIKRVKPKFPQLPAGPIVVVLTPDYTPT